MTRLESTAYVAIATRLLISRLLMTYRRFEWNKQLQDKIANRFNSFSYADLKENGSIELDGSDDQVRRLGGWREKRVCDAVRKRRTGDRSESRFQRPFLGVRTFERERGGIDAWPKDDKSFFRLFVLPPFESFDLAAISVTRKARFQSLPLSGKLVRPLYLRHQF